MDKGPLIGRGRTADIYAWGDTQVLKLFLDWCSEGMVRHELAIAQVVQSAGLPVPRVENSVVEVEARLGLIYEKVSGRSMLENLSRRPWKMIAYGRWLAELQAKIHMCRAPDLPLWSEQLERDISTADILPEMARHAALRKLAQLPQGTALCHGDFHPDNILITQSGPVVIDWMTAVRGNPMADVMRTSLLLRQGDVPSGMAGRRFIILLRELFHSVYLRRYLNLSHAQREEVDEWALPIAAARLNEGITNEQANLLRMVTRSVSGDERTN